MFFCFRLDGGKEEKQFQRISRKSGETPNVHLKMTGCLGYHVGDMIWEISSLKLPLSHLKIEFLFARFFPFKSCHLLLGAIFRFV